MSAAPPAPASAFAAPDGPAIGGLTRDELLHELLVSPRTAIVPLADSIFVERPGFWQIVTPTLTRGGLNEVICSEVEEADADAVIDAAIAEYTSRGLRFRWTVRPGTRPADLAERLAARGLVRSESLGMARATAGAGPAGGGAVSVEEVSLENVDDFTRVMAAGWGADFAPLDALHRRMLADPSGRQHLFLARFDGAPAAAAGSVTLPRSSYLMGAVALPALRGRGLYRALVNARLHLAASRGLPVATSIASAETSAPALAKMGFEVVCPIANFVSG